MLTVPYLIFCTCENGMETWWFRTRGYFDDPQSNSRNLPGDDLLCMPEAMKVWTLQMLQIKFEVHINVCHQQSDDQKLWMNLILLGEKTCVTFMAVFASMPYESFL